MVLWISPKTRSTLLSIRELISAASLIAVVVSLGFIGPASAEGVFGVNITSGSDQFVGRYRSVDDAFDQLTTDSLRNSLPSYIGDSSTAEGIVDYRGLEMRVGFDTPNSTQLNFTISDLEFSENFTGLTRDDSKDLLVDYLEGEGSNTVNEIQRTLARVSPVDPVAGNPGSLMAQQVMSDFVMATSVDMFSFAGTPGGRDLLERSIGRSTFSDAKRGRQSEGSSFGNMSSGVTRGEDDASDTRYYSEGVSSTGASASSISDSNAEIFARSPGGVMGIQMSHRSLDLDGEDSSTQTITLDYEYYFEDPLMVLRAKLPVSVTDTEGSTTYQVNAGLDFSYPITRNWTVTPGFSYGVGGSEDLGGGASINGMSLSSSFKWVMGESMYTIGNMVGKYETGSVSLGDVDLNPGISNTVFRNGIAMLKPVIWYDLPIMAQAFVIDTRYSGDELYTEHYYEVGFAFGLITDESLMTDDMFNLGLTYLDSTDSDIKGYKVNFGFRF